MYIKNNSKHYNGLGDLGYDVFNPPAYYQAMATDPTQVPYQQFPYGYGYPMPYGPYPGFALGQRTLTVDEAERLSKERKEAIEKQADISEDPEDKYLTPEGKLPANVERLLQAEKRKKKPEEDTMKALSKRILMSIIVGSILSAILR